MNVESNLGELEQIVEALDQKHDALSSGGAEVLPELQAVNKLYNRLRESTEEHERNHDLSLRGGSSSLRQSAWARGHSDARWTSRRSARIAGSRAKGFLAVWQSMATLFPVRSIECEENLEILARRLATGLGHAHEPEMEAARADREKQVARRKKRRLRRQSPRKPSCPQSFANNYARRVGQASTRPNCYLVSWNGGKGSLTSRAQSRLIHRIRCLPNDYSRNSL